MGMRRLTELKSLKGVNKMFQSINIFGRKQQAISNPVVNEVAVKLRMPVGYQGKSVPTSIVAMELLWQQYGLDLMHPEVNRWLDQNASDIKAAVARNQMVSVGENAQVKVSSRGTIEFQLSVKVDERLREVSSQYILSQMGQAIEMQNDLRLAA
jgi:hypothetical protein